MQVTYGYYKQCNKIKPDTVWNAGVPVEWVEEKPHPDLIYRTKPIISSIEQYEAHSAVAPIEMLRVHTRVNYLQTVIMAVISQFNMILVSPYNFSAINLIDKKSQSLNEPMFTAILFHEEGHRVEPEAFSDLESLHDHLPEDLHELFNPKDSDTSSDTIKVNIRYKAAVLKERATDIAKIESDWLESPELPQAFKSIYAHRLHDMKALNRGYADMLQCLGESYADADFKEKLQKVVAQSDMPQRKAIHDVIELAGKDDFYTVFYMVNSLACLQFSYIKELRADAYCCLKGHAAGIQEFALNIYRSMKPFELSTPTNPFDIALSRLRYPNQPHLLTRAKLAEAFMSEKNTGFVNRLKAEFCMAPPVPGLST